MIEEMQCFEHFLTNRLVWTDDPKGEEGPMYEVFGEELRNGTTPFEKISSLPKARLKRDGITFFDRGVPAQTISILIVYKKLLLVLDLCMVLIQNLKLEMGS